MATPRRSLFTLALLALLVPSLGARWGARRDIARMTEAAEGLLASLDDGQRERASYPIESDERSRFHFIPPESFQRHGVTLGEMDEPQRERAHALLRASLSQRGYLTATQVMELEDVLRALEGGGRLARDRDEYYVTVFGAPAPGATWAWRFEGHHISVSFTVVDGSVAVATPAFVGANPAEVREGPQRGRRVLGDREDAGRALMLALDAQQREAALIDVEAPRDIVTGNAPDVDPLAPVGIDAAEMTEPQRALLLELIDVYLGMMAEDIAEHRRDRLTASGTERIAFAWAGSVETGAPHYYRVQGPTFLIEYDNTQNDANHIHSVWREFDGDFGEDLLREHRSMHPHE